MSRYAALSREELAVLVPELLLIGQLIDRSGMAWCISSFGREEMLQIAIEEWAGASPLYTKRMQKALNYEGVDVVTIFKGLQLDIGAPPQFMDFRYTVHDRWHGGFHLDHCGALPYLTEKLGYDGPVYMTRPTAALASILLKDCRHREPSHRISGQRPVGNNKPVVAQCFGKPRKVNVVDFFEDVGPGKAIENEVIDVRFGSPLIRIRRRESRCRITRGGHYEESVLN